MPDELKNILLVEDEDDIRTVAKFALEKRGKLNVTFCSSGQEALQKVESIKPDLILLDVMMPGMDGVTTFKELKKIPSIASIPIIFMTAKVQSSEVAFYKELGAIDVISKPFNSSILAEQIREIWAKYNEEQKIKG